MSPPPNSRKRLSAFTDFKFHQPLVAFLVRRGVYVDVSKVRPTPWFPSKCLRFFSSVQIGFSYRFPTAVSLSGCQIILPEALLISCHSPAQSWGWFLPLTKYSPHSNTWLLKLFSAFRSSSWPFAFMSPLSLIFPLRRGSACHPPYKTRLVENCFVKHSTRRFPGLNLPLLRDSCIPFSTPLLWSL